MKKIFWVKPLIIAVIAGLLIAAVPVYFNAKPVWLWTDILLFLLLLFLVFLVAYIKKQPHLFRPWQRVFRRRLAMVSLIVLLFYIIAGLLDSVHFRLELPNNNNEQKIHYSVEVTSLLDIALDSIRSQVEKTYSSPFATHLYVKENIALDDGRHARDYPRLKYGGAHLLNPEEDILPDILKRILTGIVTGLLLTLLFVLLVSFVKARQDQSGLKTALVTAWNGQTGLPWRTIIITVGILLTLLSTVFILAQYYHVLGTDKVGQDVLYQSIKSIRTGLLIGTLTTLVMLPFAILLGIMAGYFRGWVDDIIQYSYTTLNSIPYVLLIAAAILSIQVYINSHPELFNTASDRADLRLLALCFVLGLTSWTGLCRLLRGESLKLREMDYIQAANAFGVSHLTIITRHILPNVMHIVLIMVVLDFSALVLAEAVLSYVGVGVDPATLSWGNMINGARLELAREPMVWWSLVAAFIFMFTLVLAANLFSDAVRDAFDPRVNEER